MNSPRADAVRDVVAVTPALVPFGVTLGVVVAATSTGDMAGWLGAPAVYSGSAQLAATTLFNRGAGLLTIVASAIAVSARLVLYSASLAPRFHGQPRWFRLVGPHFITDQTYLSAEGRPEHQGSFFRSYWLCVGCGVGAVWSAAVGFGLSLGPHLPTLPHLSLASTALFVGMLMPRMREKTGRVAALVAGVVAPLAALATPNLGVLVGTAAGISAGLAARKRDRAS
jgi:predicted branched-subunit amino acid permease